MDRSRIGIIIPAYNEAATIGEVVKSVVGLGIPIVVDDGSGDQTVELAAAAGAVVVSHAGNLGYDAALNSGFACADEYACEFAITIDADGQHNPGLLPAYITALENGADIVIGIRDRKQRFAEHIFSFASRLFWNISDPLCGLKGYSLSLYKELGHFDSYGSIGTELSIYASRQKKQIIQIPCATRDRADLPRFGRRLSGNFRIFRALFYVLTQSNKSPRSTNNKGVKL